MVRLKIKLNRKIDIKAVYKKVLYEALCHILQAECPLAESLSFRTVRNIRKVGITLVSLTDEQAVERSSGNRETPGEDGGICLLLHQDMVITTLAFPACSEPAY
jgi:hypothetical protein